jgi:hypothetical protein
MELRVDVMTTCTLLCRLTSCLTFKQYLCRAFIVTQLHVEVDDNQDTKPRRFRSEGMASLAPAPRALASSSDQQTDLSLP